MNQIHKKEWKKLQQDINKLKTKQATNAFPSGKTNKNNNSYYISVELVAGMLVGIVTGLALDKLFASSPIFLIICLMLSIIALLKTIWHKYK